MVNLQAPHTHTHTFRERERETQKNTHTRAQRSFSSIEFIIILLYEQFSVWMVITIIQLYYTYK